MAKSRFSAQIYINFLTLLMASTWAPELYNAPEANATALPEPFLKAPVRSFSRTSKYFSSWKAMSSDPIMKKHKRFWSLCQQVLQQTNCNIQATFW